MGTGQTLLALVALTILASVIISSNKVILNQTVLVTGSEAMITGTAIGQTEIEEATEKYFDGNVLPPLSTDTATAFSSLSQLGPTEPGRVAGYDTTFKDIDDYDGYSDTVETPRLGDFITTDSVYYVTETSPDVKAGTQTFFKRIDVAVRNPYLTTPGHTIMLSAIVSYRYKN